MKRDSLWSKNGLHFEGMQRAVSIAVGLLLIAQPGCGRQVEPEPSPQVGRSERASERLNHQLSPADAASPAQGLSSSRAGAASSAGSEATSDAATGWSYKKDTLRNGPWSISVLKMDRSRADFELTTTSGRGRKMGLSTLSEQVDGVPPEFGQAVAAINGDFYRTEHDSYAGDPRGLQVMRGELVSGPDGKTAFWVDVEGKPTVGNVTSKFTVTWPGGETTAFGLNEERESNDAILYTPREGTSTRAPGGRELVLVAKSGGPWLPLRIGETYSAEVKEVRETGNTRLNSDILVLSIGPALLSRVPRVKPGAVLTLSTATLPDLHGVQTALGGGPILVSGGKAQRPSVNKAYERHPRTAMGWNDSSFFFVQVDGRQPGFSVGMTLPELAVYLVKQGCQEAMNLDGGGSSEMWIDGQVVNRPCFGYERNTANALVLVRKTKNSQSAGAIPAQAAE